MQTVFHMILNMQGQKHKKTLININDFSDVDVIEVFNIASSFEGCSIKGDLERGLFVNVFFENSTRTSLSFQKAALNCGFKILDFNISSSSIAKEEGEINTIRTINSIGVNAVAIRAKFSGQVGLFSKFLNENTILINAGDGTNEHPTQSLLDLYTILEHFKLPSKPNTLSGLKVGIVGDVVNSRVARSNIFLLSRFGADLSLIAPPNFLPENFASYYRSQFKCKTFYDLNSALKQKLDVLILLRLQKERMENSGKIPFPISQFAVKDQAALDDCVIMHPGPINDNAEITSKIAYESEISLISRQVKNGVLIRSAILKFLSK